MTRTELYYKGQHQSHGLVNVDVKDVEQLLKTGNFCLPGQENVNDTDNRSSVSSRKIKQTIKRKEEPSE